MIDNRYLHLDWLRARTDQQLLEHKTVIDTLIADLPMLKGTQTPNPLAVNYVAEYLYRTAGFDQALNFINTLDQEEQVGIFNSAKMEFLLQHEHTNELEIYIEELNQRQISSPQFLLLCLKHYLGMGQRQRAESLLFNLITDHPQSHHTMEAITLATIFNLNFDRAVLEEKVRWGEKFLALEKQMLQPTKAEVLPVVYCVNLDRHPKRMKQCTDLYRNKAELRRSPGVPGNALPDYLLGSITINPALPKSAVGCSLSHIAVWERIVECDESSPPMIIVEDDGLPLMLNNTTYGITQELMAQQGLDLLYIHESASPLEFSIQEFSPDWKPAALPFQTGLGRFIRHKKNLLPGWGTYGYFLSVPGAQKLLALLERDGLTNHLDWQTFLYSATDWDHPVVRSKNNVAINYQRTTGRTPKCEINSGILNFPLIAHVDFSHSTR